MQVKQSLLSSPSADIMHLMHDQFISIDERNRALTLSSTKSSASSSMRKLVRKLDYSVPMDKYISEWIECVKERSLFDVVIYLCEWAASATACANFRAYAIVQILLMLQERVPEVSADEIHDILYEFLERRLNVLAEALEADRNCFLGLYGKLESRGLFSYYNYVQRLVARGIWDKQDCSEDVDYFT
jgi:hypothetical protein